LRWAGAYGVQADFVARSHCSIEVIKTADIKVLVLLIVLPHKSKEDLWIFFFSGNTREI
jgi:hypothetical protein